MKAKTEAWKAAKVTVIPSLRERLITEIKANRKGISTDQLRRMGSHQSVTARLSELESEGLIYKDGVTIVATGWPYSIWKPTPKKEIEAKRIARFNELKEAYFKKGLRAKFLTEKEVAQIKKQFTLF